MSKLRVYIFITNGCLTHIKTIKIQYSINLLEIILKIIFLTALKHYFVFPLLIKVPRDQHDKYSSSVQS